MWSDFDELLGSPARKALAALSVLLFVLWIVNVAAGVAHSRYWLLAAALSVAGLCALIYRDERRKRSRS